MEIQEAIDIRYEEIEGLQQKLTEDHYMNPEQEDELEELITKAIKFGELCAQRDAKAQVIPEGFVLMPLEIDDFDHPITKALEKGIVKDLSASVIYKAMIEAQEQSHE